MSSPTKANERLDAAPCSPACEDCVFWERKNNDPQSSGWWMGWCKRFPPMCPPASGSEYNRFPVTPRGLWCGEFKQANVKAHLTAEKGKANE
jgi:hypothetical protein